jgi:hypothetical protein
MHGKRTARVWQEHGKGMAESWQGHGMSWHCSCHALALLLLPCSGHALAVFFTLIDTLIPPWFGMSPACDCHACGCHVIAMPMPCPGYVFVMLLHDVALRGGTVVRMLLQRSRH